MTKRKNKDFIESDTKRQKCDFISASSIKNYMNNKIDPNELSVILKIISTMSYSTVKKNGFPSLGIYDMSYHIVREADLLAAYDVDRCIIYQMMHNKFNYGDSLQVAIDLFDKRIFQYIENDLFITNYSKQKANQLHAKAIEDIKNIKKFKNLL